VEERPFTGRVRIEKEETIPLCPTKYFEMRKPANTAPKSVFHSHLRSRVTSALAHSLNNAPSCACRTGKKVNLSLLV